MSSEPPDQKAGGARVWVGQVRAEDVAPYRLAVEQSRQRLSRWNPVDPDDLERALELQSRDRRTFLVHALDPEGDHDIVGKVNVTDVVRGRFESAAMGYDAYDPYAGRGLFAEGLRLVLDLTFRPEADGGMGLHRVAAAVQPGNTRSAGLLRSLGLQSEGFSPRLLWLPGADGSHGWRDHISYVVRAEDWPAEPYAATPGRKVVALVNGVPGSRKSALARQLAAELRIPLFSEDIFTRNAAGTLWSFLQDSPVGGVVVGSFQPDEARLVGEGLQRCGLDPSAVPEVWCQAEAQPSAQPSARPLGLGPMLGVDTGQDIGPGDVVRIALQVLAAALVPGSPAQRGTGWL